MPQHIHPLPVAPHPFYRQHRPCPVNGFLPTHTPTTHAHTHTHTHSPSRLTGATWTIFQCAYGIGGVGSPSRGPQRVSGGGARARGCATARGAAAAAAENQAWKRNVREKKKAIEPADAKIVARATCVSVIADFLLLSPACGKGSVARLIFLPCPPPLLVAFPAASLLGDFLCPPPLVLSGWLWKWGAWTGETDRIWGMLCKAWVEEMGGKKKVWKIEEEGGWGRE